MTTPLRSLKLINKIKKSGVVKTGSMKKDAEKKEDCWPNYKQIGMKTKNGKQVPNCVPESNEWVCGQCNCDPCVCEGDVHEDAPTVNTTAIPDPGKTAMGPKFKTSLIHDRRKKKGTPKLLKRFADYYTEKGIG